MNPRTTWIWLGVAAVLFAFIFLFERHFHRPPPGPIRVLPAFKAGEVTTVQVQPLGQSKIIRAERSHGEWRLAEAGYPARTSSIEGLLSFLEKLTAATYITPAELKKHTETKDAYGFDPPQDSLIIDQGNRTSRLWIGNKTAPGDQVFLEVVGVEGVYVVDAELLKWIPRTLDDWRDPSLVDFQQFDFDGLVVTNAGNILDLQRDPTNKLWRMILPDNTRADGDKIEAALQRLHGLRATRFITDDPNADLDAYGLGSPDLSLAFMRGTNTTLLLAFGRSPTNEPGLLYARRSDQHTVVTVSRDRVEPWLASHDFRVFIDRHLLVLPQPADEIEIHGQDHFTLQHQTTNNLWMVVPQGFPADAGQVKKLIDELSAMQATRIEKDVVVAPDLPTYGLDAPARQYIFKAATTNAGTGPTNIVIAQLDFGTKGDKVFAQRLGESFVYAVDPNDLKRLPSASWQMRERRIWNFSTNDVARLIIQQGNKTRGIIRNGPASWSLAPGSEGIINSLALDPIVELLGQLTAANWVERGIQNRADYGFKDGDYRLVIELKDGRKLTVEIGGIAPSKFPYAMTVLDGQPWVFEFPLSLSYGVQNFLTIPPDAP